MKIRTYTELSQLQTFEERYQYVYLGGTVGRETFGSRRWLNQKFYTSPEWKRIRNKVILRDMGCDLGLDGYEIHGSIYVHHMNPVTVDDIIGRTPFLLDPEYLICVSFATHEAITFSEKDIQFGPIERKPNDTCPWRK